MDHRVELLAPAGNPESFYGAIHAGADAVYLGGQRFGARAYADNFTAEEIQACIRYAHIWGRKVYLTVNTLVKEAEFDELVPYLKPFYEAGLDGVIVQDLGVFTLIREHFPQLKLHVSTQMTLTGKYGAKLLKKLGAVRVVPARELTLPELVEIKRFTGLEVEVFVHGAMCYCYSGQCLFSSILGGRSGNRGRCAQPCRLPYRVGRDHGVTDECYPLSLKDLCAIEHIPELIEAGIDSFKIEGRMKKPEYTAGVTAIYRKWIDRYYDARETVSEEELARLAALYIRSERQTGYFFRQNGRDMVTLDNPSYSGSDESLLAEIRENYLDKSLRMNLSVRAVFRVGQPAEVSFAMAHEGRKIHASAEGVPVSGALRQPITEENIQNQIDKLGNTSFQIEQIEIEVDDNAFYPLKAINELRRQAVRRMEDALIAANGFSVERTSDAGDEGHDRYITEPAKSTEDAEESAAEISGQNGPIWHLAVRSREQLDAVIDSMRAADGEHLDFRLRRLYLEADLLMEAEERHDETFFRCCNDLHRGGCEMVLALPYILRQRDEAWLVRLWDICLENRELFSGVLARSLEGLGFWQAQQKSGSWLTVYGDAGLYVWNRQTLRTLEHLPGDCRISGFCLPYELNAGEQRRLLEGLRLPCEKIVYGRIPLMITANCVANTIDGCRSSSGAPYVLTDRYKKRFPVFRDCRRCANIIYNCVPLSLHGEISKWKDKAGLCLHFTVESGAETAEVLQYFMRGAAGKPPFGEYTAGHEKRGAE